MATEEDGTMVDRSCGIHVTAETSRIARVLVPTSGIPNSDAALVAERQFIANIVVPVLRASRCSILAVPERRVGEQHRRTARRDLRVEHTNYRRASGWRSHAVDSLVLGNRDR